jgi:hypothetical protein
MQVRYQAALRPDWVKIIPERLRNVAGFTGDFLRVVCGASASSEGRRSDEPSHCNATCNARASGACSNFISPSSTREFLARVIQVAGLFQSRRQVIPDIPCVRRLGQRLAQERDTARWVATLTGVDEDPAERIENDGGAWRQLDGVFRRLLRARVGGLLVGQCKIVPCSGMRRVLLQRCFDFQWRLFRLAVGLVHRNGQATVVKTRSASVSNTGLLGAWTVTANKSIAFSIDVASSDLLNFRRLRCIGGTCQNDVIEGVVRVVPIPGTLALLGLGLLAMAGVARRKRGA